MEGCIVQIATVATIKHEEPGNAGANKCRYELPENEVPGLRERRFNDTEQKNCRGTERRDNDRRVIVVAKDGLSSHDCFDRENATESSDQPE